jgi:hypothetical protein
VSRDTRCRRARSAWAAEAAEHVEVAIDPPKLINGFGEYQVQQRRRGRIEHVAEVIVGRGFGDAEHAAQLEKPGPASDCRRFARNDRLSMKNAEKAAIPMLPMPQVVFMPRRLSGTGPSTLAMIRAILLPGCCGYPVSMWRHCSAYVLHLGLAATATNALNRI